MYHSSSIAPAPYRIFTNDERLSSSCQSVKEVNLTMDTTIDQPSSQHRPIFIIAISFVQISIFFWYIFQNESSDLLSACAGCFNESDAPGPLVFLPELAGVHPLHVGRARYQLWRFVTYQFLHEGLEHLLGNIAFQVLVGVRLEVVHGSLRICAMHTTAIVLGALLQSALNPDAYLVGTSAAVYALVAADLIDVLQHWPQHKGEKFRLAVLGAFLLLGIGGPIYARLAFPGARDTTSHAAHLAGAATGACFGAIIWMKERGNRRIHSDQQRIYTV